MLNLLKAVFNIIDVKPEDVLLVNTKYRALLRPLRIKLKSLHPDEGGTVEEFDKVCNVYESLLKQSRQDPKETILTSNLNTFICFSEQQLSNIDDFNIVLKEFIRPKKPFGVLLSELVLHFNRLKYCQLFEPTDITQDTVQTSIHIECNEHIENEIHNSSTIVTRNMSYNPTGKYKIDLSLNLEGPAKLKFHLDGFEMSVTKNITQEGLYSVEFEENFIKFSIQLQIKMQS